MGTAQEGAERAGARRETRVRRSLLITPANQPQRVAKACGLAAEGVVLDLEDGVGVAEKGAARRALRNALATFDFGWRERIVRVNAPSSAHFAADLECLDLGRVDAIFLPKVETAEDVTEDYGVLLWLWGLHCRNRRKGDGAGAGLPRALIVAAAAAVGIEAIDAAHFAAVKVAEATCADALVARELGFSGKLVFHPIRRGPYRQSTITWRYAC